MFPSRMGTRFRIADKRGRPGANHREPSIARKTALRVVTDVISVTSGGVCLGGIHIGNSSKKIIEVLTKY